MTQEGFPTGSVVYLDIEIGGPVSQQNLDYAGAWIQGVFNSGFIAGVYCNAASHVTEQVCALDSRTIFWGINLSPFNFLDLSLFKWSKQPHDLNFRTPIVFMKSV